MAQTIETYRQEILSAFTIGELLDNPVTFSSVRDKLEQTDLLFSYANGYAGVVETIT